MRRQHGIDHLADRPLLGGGQCPDAFQLLGDLRLRPAFAGAAPVRGCRSQQRFHVDPKPIGKGRQRPGQQAQAAGLVVRQRLPCPSALLAQAHELGGRVHGVMPLTVAA